MKVTVALHISCSLLLSVQSILTDVDAACEWMEKGSILHADEHLFAVCVFSERNKQSSDTVTVRQFHCVHRAHYQDKDAKPCPVWSQVDVEVEMLLIEHRDSL